ncbi:MAG: hypothetical protein QNJ74_27130 [Trichodesmium sp. MO_231.B1]|nr:hypothetical protein [Trichodesmium sp. MO_231.B1]
MKMWFWRNSLVGWVKRSRNPTDTYGFHLTSGKYLLLLGFVTSTQPTLATPLVRLEPGDWKCQHLPLRDLARKSEFKSLLH